MPLASLAERIARAFPEIGQVELLREVGLGARSLLRPLMPTSTVDDQRLFWQS